MSRRFGVLLRHYWLPATELTYRRTTNVQKPGDDLQTTTQTIHRKPAKCNSDVCVWRESVDRAEEHFCIYNRSEQTFRRQGILEFTATPETETDARIQAFLHQPVLTPLLPIPVGFQWHIRADDGFLEFTLDSETTVEDMPVVMIRRNGRFSVGDRTVERTGITAVARERSLILEDRTRDVFDDGTEIQTVFQLLESRLLS